MTELVKSIVLCAMGIIVILAGLIIGDVNTEVYVFGGLLTFCGAIWVVLDILNKKKQK